MPPALPPWASWRKNIFQAEDGNGAAGNGGGAGQFEPGFVSKFRAQNPQFASTPITDSTMQNRMYQADGEQYINANPKAATDPGQFYASYALGPQNALKLDKASPSALAASVIGDPTAVKGNPELFANNATVAETLARAAKIATTGAMPSGGGSGGSGPIDTGVQPPGASSVSQGGAPPQSTSDLINSVLGGVPAGGPNVHNVAGLGASPLWSMAAGMLSQEPKGSVAGMLGAGAQAAQKTSLQTPLINNQVAETKFNDALNRAKVGAQLADLNAPRPYGWQPVQTGTDAQGNPTYSIPTVRGLSGQGGLSPLNPPQGGSVSPEAVYGQQAHEQASAGLDNFKIDNGLYGHALQSIKSLPEEIQDGNQLVANLSNPNGLSAMGPGVLKDMQRKLVTSFPGLSSVVGFTSQGVQVQQNALAQLREGSLSVMKSIFGARPTNFDTQLIAPVALSLANSPDVGVALVKAANQAKQLQLSVDQQVAAHIQSLPRAQRTQFLSTPGNYQNLYNSIYKPAFQKVFANYSNPQPEVGFNQAGGVNTNVGQTNTTQAGAPNYQAGKPTAVPGGGTITIH